MTTTNTNTYNLLENAALIQVSISTFGNYRKEGIGAHDGDGDPSMLHTTKKLLPPEALKPIESIRGKVTTYLNEWSLPFPMHGIRFVPTAYIEQVDAKLREYQQEFYLRVTELERSYEDVIAEAQARLNGHFNPAQYPARQVIRSKFGMTWQFITIQMPSSISQANSALVEEQQRRFDEQMEAFKNEAMTALRENFVSLVDRLVRVTANKKGSGGRRSPIHQSLFDDFNHLFSTFSTLNVTNDEELEELIEDARQRLAGTDASDVRQSGYLRRTLNESFSELQSSMEERLQVDLPTRRINMSSGPQTLADEEAEANG